MNRNLLISCFNIFIASAVASVGFIHPEAASCCWALAILNAGLAAINIVLYVGTKKGSI